MIFTLIFIKRYKEYSNTSIQAIFMTFSSSYQWILGEKGDLTSTKYINYYLTYFFIILRSDEKCTCALIEYININQSKDNK